MCQEHVVITGRPKRLTRLGCEPGSIVVVLEPAYAGIIPHFRKEEQMSFIGLDVHKKFINGAVIDSPSEHAKRVFTIPTKKESITRFASSLSPSDSLALESTTHAFPIANLIRKNSNGANVVVSNPMKTKVINESKNKSDSVDALALANLLASGYLPVIWEPDSETGSLRKITSYAQAIGRDRTAVKNRVHSILHRNLIEYSGISDLFGNKGRKVLFSLSLPEDEQLQLAEELETLDFLDRRFVSIKERMAKVSVKDNYIKRLMTIPGIDYFIAFSLKAAIGNDISRFKSPKKLVGYFGLCSSVYQSADKRYTGKITKRGRSHARWVLVQAAQAIVKSPSPLRAFFLRIKNKRGRNKAIVAVAAKLSRIIWNMLTKGEDYFYSPPLRTKEKLAKLRIIATGEKMKSGPKKGIPSAGGRTAYLKARKNDKTTAKSAECDYVKFIKERFSSRKSARRTEFLS